MKKFKNKFIAFLICIFFVVSIVSTTLISNANGHTPAWNIPTWAYLSASPSHLGVGENTQLIMWIGASPPTAGGAEGDLWHNYFINITAPDGTMQRLGPFTSLQTGSTWTTFTPTQTGNYTCVFYFTGQVAGNGSGTPNHRVAAYVGDYFEPSVSEPITLVVTETPTQIWKESPLPTEYWSRPINAANRDWSMLASNWLLGSWLVGNFQRYGQAPNSAHILWQKPITPAYAGGMADGQWPGIPYNVNDYESPWSSPIIMGGIIYYNAPKTAATTGYGYYALDLYTGEQLFYKNGTDNGLNNPVSLAGYGSGKNTAPELSQTFPRLSFGQLYDYSSVNGVGMTPYLWMTVGSKWYMLDSSTGNWILTLVNVPGGTTVTGQDGSILRYSYNEKTGNLLCWNSSQSIPPAGPTGTSQQQWKPRVGATIDAVNDTSWTTFGARKNEWTTADILPRSGYTMNVTIQAGLPTTTMQKNVSMYGTDQGIGGLSVIQDENRVPQELLYFANPTAVRETTGNNGDFYAWVVKINYGAAPYSPSPSLTATQNNNLGYTATLLWNKHYTPEGNLTISNGPISYEDGVWTTFTKETAQWTGYSLETGEKLWQTNSENPWDIYGDDAVAAYGNLYTCGYGGILYCYDMKTGALKWTYTASNQGEESPYGDNYPLNIGAISDGKVFLYSTEHSPTKPLWRGSDIRAIDANNGTEVWKIQNFDMGLAISNGYLVSGNAYNNMIECYGKGPSSTTISAPQIGITTATPITFTGTVMDISPGASVDAVANRFPNGLPVVSDDSMEHFMESVYMQQAMPTNLTGVPVTLNVVDANGNYRTIGTTVSNAYGTYSLTWTPDISGDYTVIASFAGTESYYPSQSATAFFASEPAPTPTPQPTQTPSAADLYFLPAIAGLFVAIIVCIALSALVLMKKP